MVEMKSFSRYSVSSFNFAPDFNERQCTVMLSAFKSVARSTPFSKVSTLSPSSPAIKSILTEKIYVNVPNSESNINKHGDVLPELYNHVDKNDYFKDLLLYLAIGLTALVFIEWWLRSHDSW